MYNTNVSNCCSGRKPKGKQCFFYKSSKSVGNTAHTLCTLAVNYSANPVRQATRSHATYTTTTQTTTLHIYSISLSVYLSSPISALRYSLSRLARLTLPEFVCTRSLCVPLCALNARVLPRARAVRAARTTRGARSDRGPASAASAQSSSPPSSRSSRTTHSSAHTASDQHRSAHTQLINKMAARVVAAALRC